MITQQQLIQLVYYDPLTGIFTHKTNTTHKRIGDRAGFLHKGTGYRHICVSGNEYKEHRLAFLYMEGKMPNEVDHKDRVKDNNRWDNLRPSTRSLNCVNQRIRKDNTTGVKGLSFVDDNKFCKWVVRIQRNKKQVRRSFRNKEDAIQYINEFKG